MKNTPLFAYLLLTLSSLAWAGNIVIGRAFSTDFPPIGLSFWRWAVAWVILFFFTWPIILKNAAVIRREWKLILLLGVLGMAGFHPLQYLAVQTTTAINATLILATTPAIVAILSAFFFKEKIKRHQLLGITISFIGVISIVTKANLQVIFELKLTSGDMWMLMATVIWSLYSIAVKFKPADLHPYALLTSSITVGLFFLFPLYLWETMNIQPMPFTGTAVASVAYVSIVASLLAYLAFNQGVSIIGPQKAGLFINLIPVFTTILAIVALNEKIELYHYIGMVVIGVGLYVSAKPESKKLGEVAAE